MMYPHFEDQYVKSLKHLLHITQQQPMQGDRTGTGTWKKPFQTFSFNVQHEIPILAGKKMMFNSALVEMLWIMSGGTNTAYLKKHGVNYWDQWADENGDLGEIYGHQMRNFNGTDQLKDIIESLLFNWDSRRHIINLWNPSRIQHMKLPPCHFLYQFVTQTDKNGKKFADLCVTQRSADSFLGVPYDFLLFYDIAKIISKYVGFELRGLHIALNDYHIYSNHIDAVKKYITQYEQLVRERDVADELQQTIPTPEVTGFVFEKTGEGSFEEFEQQLMRLVENPGMVELHNYNHKPFVKAQVAV